MPLQARTIEERRTDALKRLGSGYQMWLATGSDGHGAHLIPVAYVWDARMLTTATFVRSRTAANLRARPRARLAFGEFTDLVMVDATACFVEVEAIEPKIADRFAAVSHDPRVMPGLVYIRLVPQRVLVWNGFHEFAGRTVMADGRWLEKAVD